MGASFNVAFAVADRLRNLAQVVSLRIAERNLEETKCLVDQMDFLAALLKLSWPLPEIPPPVGKLVQHIDFLERFALKTNWEMMKSNADDFPRDLEGIGASLRAEQPAIPPALGAGIAALPEGISKSFLLESVASLEAGAYKAAIVMAGASLEHYVRETYESATGKRSKNLDFIEVIKELEGLPPGRVHAQHLAMANALRIYRNLTAHPSEFDDAKAYAPGLVQLACATLTGMKE